MLEVAPEVLQPRIDCQRKILKEMSSSACEPLKMAELVSKVAELTKHNQKTVRLALGTLAFEGKVQIYNLPKSAVKMVILTEAEDEKIYAS